MTWEIDCFQPDKLPSWPIQEALFQVKHMPLKNRTSSLHYNIFTGYFAFQDFYWLFPWHIIITTFGIPIYWRVKAESHIHLVKDIVSYKKKLIQKHNLYWMIYFYFFQSQKYISHFNSNIQTDICSWVQFGIDYYIEIREKCVFFVVIAKP